MTADQHGKSRRPYSYGFEFKVLGGEAKDLEGTFKVSTMRPGETFDQRVIGEIHRAIDALEN
jgi:hypothetical protein